MLRLELTTYLVVACHQHTCTLSQTLYEKTNEESLSDVWLLEVIPDPLRTSGFKLKLFVDLKKLFSSKYRIWIVRMAMELHKNVQSLLSSILGNEPAR